MNIIKLFTFLIVFATNILAFPVDLKFEYENQWKTGDFSVKINPVGNFWLWEGNPTNYPVLGVNSDYPQTFEDDVTIGFDCPKGITVGRVMPWGVIDIEVVWDDRYGVERTVNFRIDFRDETWAAGSKYLIGSRDTHILIPEYGSYLYCYVANGVVDNKKIEDGFVGKIWTLWNFEEDNTAQENFCVPVTLKNRLEDHSTYDFGQLLGNGILCNSGSLGKLRALIPGPVAHSTTYYEDAGIPRQNSFVWEYENITPVESEFPYNSSNLVEVPSNTLYKEVTRNFRKVYPITIKNILSENGGISVDNIYFKDPLLDNQFHTYSVAPNGYTKNEAFHDLSITVDNQPEQKYAVKAKESFQHDGRDYYWFNGDFNPSTGTDITVTSPSITRSANFKGTHLSNNTNAFASGSQRKFVKTEPTTTYPNGVLHFVYESMGAVWYEHSTDNGQTWVIADGKPVYASAQNPSIAVQNNSLDTDRKVIIIYETSTELKCGFYIDGHRHTTTTIENNPVDNPVVAWAGNDRIVVAYELDLGGTGSGIYYNVADMPTTSTIDWEFDLDLEGVTGHKVLNTSENSTNPTITHQSSTNYFHLAWQENTSAIKYIKMTYTGGKAVMVFSDYAEPSYNGPNYYYNVKPSITVFDNQYPILSWISENYEDQIRECAIRYKNLSGWTYQFWYFGYSNHMEMVNIHSSTSNDNFIFAMAGSQNNDQYIKSNSTTTVYVLPTKGDVQVCNGGGFSGMRIQSFDKYNTPYDFTLSGADGLLKTNGTNNVLVARQFDLLNDDLNVQAGISEVTVDGDRIPFVGEDSFLDNSLLDFESKLETEPFTLTNNSEFTFSFNQNASVLTPAALTTSNSVNIKVMLVDAQTDETIGVLHENIIDGTQQILSGVNNFLVNTSGIGEREVKLAIDVTDKLENKSDYTVTTRVISEGGELQKNNYEEITFTGESPVTEYSLAQNFPNPFNPTTRISYQIPNDGNVSLKIYDVLGAEVMTLVNTTQTQGRYEVSFDASQLSSGVYIYRIQANKFVESKKMMLLK